MDAVSFIVAVPSLCRASAGLIEEMLLAHDN